MQEEPQPQMPPGAEQPAQPVSLPRALQFQLQQPAPQVPQASVAQPQVQPRDASAPLSLLHLSLLCPPWSLLLPLLPRPLLPEDVCAPSPQHPREWNSSAFSFP